MPTRAIWLALWFYPVRALGPLNPVSPPGPHKIVDQPPEPPKKQPALIQEGQARTDSQSRSQLGSKYEGWSCEGEEKDDPLKWSNIVGSSFWAAIGGGYASLIPSKDLDDAGVSFNEQFARGVSSAVVGSAFAKIAGILVEDWANEEQSRTNAVVPFRKSVVNKPCLYLPVGGGIGGVLSGLVFGDISDQLNVHRLSTDRGSILSGLMAGAVGALAGDVLYPRVRYFVSKGFERMKVSKSTSAYEKMRRQTNPAEKETKEDENKENAAISKEENAAISKAINDLKQVEEVAGSKKNPSNLYIQAYIARTAAKEKSEKVIRQ